MTYEECGALWTWASACSRSTEFKGLRQMRRAAARDGCKSVCRGDADDMACASAAIRGSFRVQTAGPSVGSHGFSAHLGLSRPCSGPRRQRWRRKLSSANSCQRACRKARRQHRRRLATVRATRPSRTKFWRGAAMDAPQEAASQCHDRFHYP